MRLIVDGVLCRSRSVVDDVVLDDVVLMVLCRFCCVDGVVLMMLCWCSAVLCRRCCVDDVVNVVLMMLCLIMLC